MHTVITTFLRLLRRQRNGHRVGLALRECMRIAGYAVVALLVYAIADFALSFSVVALHRIGGTLLVVGILLALWRLGRVWRYSTKDYARHVDRVRAHRRHDIYAAYQLADQAADADYLIERLVGGAHARLQDLRWKDAWPYRALAGQGRILLFQVVLVGLLLGIPHGVSQVVLERIFFPDRDRPPYSPYEFVVNPAEPEVLYGDGVELNVEIGGGPVRDTVVLLTRVGNDVQRAVCFQEGPSQFAQRVGNVIQPMEFAFGLGRARSEWHPIHVLFDPRVIDVKLEVEPPEYSGKPTRTVRLGDEPVAELAGSRLQLTLESNRPLRDGYLTVRAANGDDEREVSGRLLDTHRLQFDWDLAFAGEVTAVIRDVRGTESQQPLVFAQDVTPDQPPRVALTSPAGFVLATPDASINVAGYAEDDLGLRRVDLARGMVGYRDRMETLSVPPNTRRQTFERELDLGALGVAPGQILEFYLEAQDTNPDWSGVSVSEVVRVEIIDEEEYARLWRARVRAEDFMARYREAMSAWNELKRGIEEFLEQAEEEPPTEEALAALKEKYDEVQEQMQRLAADFPVYEAEQSFQRTLQEMEAVMSGHRPALEDREPDDPRLAQRLEMVLQDLQAFDTPMAEHQETARHIQQVARMFELSQRYLQLVQAQEQLVRRMDRYPDPGRLRDAGLFDSFQREETQIREALITLRAELIERAEALDDEYEPLKVTALEFAEAIEELEIPDVMNNMIRAAENRSGQEMVNQAELALERMRLLLTECEGTAFGGLMDCELTFEVRTSARRTLQQMMQAWSGLGTGSGPGMGSGDGYSVSAHTPLNVPLHGPGRSDRHRPVEGGGPGDAARGRGPGAAQVDEQQRLWTEPGAGQRPGVGDIETAPERYRDALRRYFGWEE